MPELKILNIKHYLKKKIKQYLLNKNQVSYHQIKRTSPKPNLDYYDRFNIHFLFLECVKEISREYLIPREKKSTNQALIIRKKLKKKMWGKELHMQ